MSRIRTIKPEFFTNEEIATISPLERLLFIGLWTEADKLGRLTDRPKTLKVKLLPWDDCDVDAMLQRLHEIGLIHRYEVAGVRCIAIPSFEKHQRPHPKETDLGLPSPPSREISRQAVNDPHPIPSSPGGREGKGREGDLGSGKESPPPPSKIPVPTAPPKAPDDPLADGPSFFAAVQVERADAGLPREKPPNPRAISAWWSEALMELNGDPAPLVEAFKAYAKDPFWLEKLPPIPFPGFMSQWRKYVPVRTAA